MDNITNNGIVMPATLRGGENVYVVGGNISLNGVGSINDEQSDKQIIIVKDGERKVVGVAEIASIGETIDAEEEKLK